MKSLFDELKNSEAVKSLITEFKKKNSLLIEGLTPSQKAFVLSLAKESGKSILILTGSSPEEFKLHSDLPYFTDMPIVELPAWETLPSEHIAPSPDIVGSRYQTLKFLAEKKEPVCVLTTLQSCLQKVTPPKFFKTQCFTVSCGSSYNFEELIQNLQKIGYERKSVASDKGEFAYRGGIIDIFPVAQQEPYRIEFFGNEVDSIRTYSPASQKSQSAASSVEITPAKELEIMDEQEKLSTIFDYLGKDPLVVLDDLEALEDRYASLTSLGGSASKIFLGIEELLDIVSNMMVLSFSQKPIEDLTQVTVLNAPSKNVKFYSTSQSPYEISFEMFQRNLNTKRIVHPFQDIGEYLQQEYSLDEEPVEEELLNTLSKIKPHPKVFFISQNETEENSIKKKLEEYKIHHEGVHFVRGYLSSGFAISDIKTILFPSTELTHRLKIRRERLRTSYRFTGTEAFELNPGESIVHYNHGIGKFLGIDLRKNHLGIEQEFFNLEYSDGAKLLIPLTQAHLLSKYIGSGEVTPKFHALGTQRWKKLREQTEKAIVGYASELLKLYAERQIHGGFAFPNDSKETFSFEETFPYIETEDQIKAINEVKEDMCSSKAMDRLVCGDVGYGKTEVALRAAFKAVVDGKMQVAVLVPTTVLAVQHYENFLDRMKSFSVNVALLSRFQKAKEVKDILAGMKNGTVDIVVGTHRLIQDDIEFKKLGLVIIDEEQRFGVKAKEHLKHLKSGVDCLTLTATPIPRTLHMSLVGAKDLSVINTPPSDRIPIKTIITTPDDQLIQTALLRELNRDGQAYFIHNFVETIYDVASRIKRLLPKARVVVGHGQMSGKELDIVFHTFKRGDADILIATSIIENGIDIPNANTILIDNADRFGISDLYQLRGRVGRWNRRAYAYFLIPKEKRLSEIAKKRMDAISQVSGYGGGIKMALRDLEMRGAGDILGIEQSGHIADIGFHLYCKLLKRTIETMQGKAPSWTLETKIDTPYDARLPEYYVNDQSLRMEIYQRLGDALTSEEVDSLWDEIKDRFGKPPEPALWLYHTTRIRVFASQRGITTLKFENSTLSYDKKSGTEIISNKAFIGKVKSPEELEKKITKAIVSPTEIKFR